MKSTVVSKGTYSKHPSQIPAPPSGVRGARVLAKTSHSTATFTPMQGRHTTHQSNEMLVQYQGSDADSLMFVPSSAGGRDSGMGLVSASTKHMTPKEKRITPSKIGGAASSNNNSGSRKFKVRQVKPRLVYN